MSENKKEAVPLPQKIGITPEREKEISEELKPVYDRMTEKLITTGHLDPDSVLSDAYLIARTIGEGVLVGVLVANSLKKIRDYLSTAEGGGKLEIVNILHNLKKVVKENHAARNN